MTPAAADLEIQCFGATHTGHVRKHNEDAFLLRPDIGLWAVADGMGGHSRGDLASGWIVDELRLVERGSTGFEFMNDVRARLAAVNARLVEEARARGGHVIGSTVVVLL